MLERNLLDLVLERSDATLADVAAKLHEMCETQRKLLHLEVSDAVILGTGPNTA